MQKLWDAAGPAKPHAYEWYVIANISAPEERMERTPELKTAIRAYAALDCADKRLGVTKGDIAAVDLMIRQDDREWIPEDSLKSECFRSDPAVAAAVAEIRKATGTAMRLTG